MRKKQFYSRINPINPFRVVPRGLSVSTSWWWIKFSTGLWRQWEIVIMIDCDFYETPQQEYFRQDSCLRGKRQRNVMKHTISLKWTSKQRESWKNEAKSCDSWCWLYFAHFLVDHKNPAMSHEFLKKILMLWFLIASKFCSAKSVN